MAGVTSRWIELRMYALYFTAAVLLVSPGEPFVYDTSSWHTFARADALAAFSAFLALVFAWWTWRTAPASA